MSQNLIQQSLFNLLKSRQSQHFFSAQKIECIVKAIIEANRQTLQIDQQVRQIIKTLQQSKLNETKSKKTFQAFELEWIMNWLIDTYYTHVKLIKSFEDEIVRKTNNNQEQISQNQQQNSIELLIDLPAFVQPLHKAKLVREGGMKIFPDDRKQGQEQSS